MRELIETILMLSIPAAIVLFWHSSMRARERAITLCRLTCENYQAQLLDQTVSLKKIGLSRNRQGRLQFERCYSFDYSYDGIARLRGEVAMHGLRSDLIELEPNPETLKVIH